MSIVITGGSVFDGTGSNPAPGEVVVEGDRITDVRVGHHPELHEGHDVLDATGCTVMPGLIESHAHLTFPSAVGHIDPSFNPPLDMSFFGKIEGFPSELARAERNAGILLDAGFTSAFSAGSLIGMPTENALRDKVAAGAVPGPRLRTCAAERDAVPRGPVDRPEEWGLPQTLAEWVTDHAKQGYDSVKLLLSNDDVFFPGGSQVTQYETAQAEAASAAAREHGVWLAAHCQAAESVKLAVRNGFRSIYHCTYADEEALDLLEEAKDQVFVSPAVGIIWSNVHAGEEFGIDAAAAEKMGSVACLDAMRELYPKMRERGIRVLPGGDYGFPNNPIGKNAHDLSLFVSEFGYSPIEALVAATKLGGELMALETPVGVLASGYLADLLIVKGDPTVDVSVLEDADNLVAIMQGGSMHKAPAGS